MKEVYANMKKTITIGCLLLLPLTATAEGNIEDLVVSNAPKACSEVVEYNPSNSSVICTKGRNGLVQYEVNNQGQITKILQS